MDRRGLLITLLVLLLGLVGGYFLNDAWQLRADDSKATLEAEVESTSAALNSIEKDLNESDAMLVINEDSFSDE